MNIRKKRKAEGVPVAAMGDIAFLLMIFYMSTTLVTDQKPVEIPIPEVEGRTMTSPYPLIIYMDRKLAAANNVYFFAKAVPVSSLGGAIQERAMNAPAAVRVYLNIEKDLPYAHMDAVIEELKKAGIKNLVITTRPPGEAAAK